jgi:hypothetical protein
MNRSILIGMVVIAMRRILIGMMVIALLVVLSMKSVDRYKQSHHANHVSTAQ